MYFWLAGVAAPASPSQLDMHQLKLKWEPINTLFNPFLKDVATLWLENCLGEEFTERSMISRTCIGPQKYVAWPQMQKSKCSGHFQFRHFPIRASQVKKQSQEALGLTPQNRKPLPELLPNAFPLETLFPGTNWTLNQACQSLFPGPGAKGSVDTDGLPGKASETLSTLLLLASGRCRLLKCQNPDFCCKTCSLECSLSVSSRQESSWV